MCASICLEGAPGEEDDVTGADGAEVPRVDASSGGSLTLRGAASNGAHIASNKVAAADLSGKDIMSCHDNKQVQVAGISM